MKRLEAAIVQLYKIGARHRRGFKLAELTPEMIANNIIDEAQKLKDEIMCPLVEIKLRDEAAKDEVADVVAACVHMAMRLGMSVEQLEQRVLDKLAKRFVVD